jgi:dihydropyrimidinase
MPVLIPAGVDPHTHPLGDLRTAGEEARRGGTTTLLAFTAPRPGEMPAAAYARARDELVPLTDVAVHLHPAIWEPDRLTRADLVELARLGARAVKLFLAYGELGMKASDRTLYETLRDATRLGMLVRVHCENGDAVDALVDEKLAAGHTGPEGFVASRPGLVEEEAVERTLTLARLADAPVYLVHLTTAASLDLVRRARARGQVVWAEACTHHLLLDDTCYLRADAARYLVVPPLRARTDVDALWQAIEDGTIDAVGSDHATAPFVPQVEAGDFRSLPYGFGGVGLRVPLVLSEGTRRGLPIDDLSRVLSSGPARAFGLDPPGECIQWDPAREWTVEGGPFDGLLVRGAFAG